MTRSGRRLLSVGLVMLVVGCGAPALMQQAGAQQPWSPPRDAYGRPDLQGAWTNSSITTLERSDPSLPLVLSPEQASKMEKSRERMNAAADAPTSAEEGAPRAGSGVGGYNNFWLDRGAKVGVVKGTARSSWIVDPPNGRIPPMTPAGKKRTDAVLALRSEDGPEGMNPADRCLVGSRGSGGPPMLNNIYNNTYQIVQTRDHVMIDVEMMHDARIIRIDGAPKPPALEQWLGDSVGRWEGDTLVVTTRGWKRLHGDYEPVFLSPNAVVTERFSRTAKDEITYEFVIEDPDTYTQTWRGEMVFTPSNGPVYEYACHEGNYALEHILQGARVADGKRG